MASERFFTGFEAGQPHDINVMSQNYPSTVVCDGTARTGDFHFQIYHPLTTGATAFCSRSYAHAYTCVNSGDSVVARMQIPLKLGASPTADTNQIFGFSRNTTVAPAQDARVYILANRTITVQASSSSNITPVNLGFALQLNKWYVLRLEFTYQKSGTSPTRATIWIYDGDTMDGEDGPTLLATGASTGLIITGDYALTGPPTLGNGSSITGTLFVTYDDWWYGVADGADAAAPNTSIPWPTGSRIMPVLVTRQISSTWTGGFDLVRELPNSGVAGNEQTAAGNGITGTFGHKTAAQLGLIPPGQTDPLDPDPPPFTGAIAPIGGGALDGFSGGAGTIFGTDSITASHDGSIPVPAGLFVTPVAGGGSYTGGVWVRAATLKVISGAGGSVSYRTSPFTAAQYIDAGAYPNFSLNITAAHNAATPADAFVGGPPSSPWVRYGIVVEVTNAYTAGGTFDPSTGPWTGLSISGGEGVIDATPFGSLVALYTTSNPSTLPPYPASNPGARPLTYTFPLLTSPRQQSAGAGAAWTPIFAPPGAIAGETVLPVCAAIKVYGNIKRTSGTGTDNLLINSTAYPVAVAASYFANSNPQIAYDFTEKTAEEFDAFTFGASTGSASATQLGNIFCEVMTAGPTVRRVNTVSAYQQKAGIFTSNGGFQSIACGFKPTWVFVKRIGNAAAGGAMKAWWMGGTLSWPITASVGSLSNLESIAIMDLIDTGFIVGPAQNANGNSGGVATYAYVAVCDGAQDINNGAYTITGTYFREDTTTTTDRTVSIGYPLAFVPTWTPDFLWIIGGGINVVKTPQVATGSSIPLSSPDLLTDGILSLGNGAFTIGANSFVATAGQYAYIAMKQDAGGLLASVFASGSFVGNGSPQVIPTPFAPELTVAAKPGNGYAPRFRSTSGNTGTDSVLWAGGGVTANDIIAIGASSFTAGTNLSVNGVTSYWWIWKGAGSFGTVGDTDLFPPDDSDDTPDEPSADICSGGGLKLATPTINGTGCVRC